MKHKPQLSTNGFIAKSTMKDSYVKGAKRAKKAGENCSSVDPGSYGESLPSEKKKSTKKRKQVTLTLTTDPVEEMVATKRIKTEIMDSLSSDGATSKSHLPQVRV